MATPPPSILYSATDLTLIIGACASAIVGIIAGIRLSRCTHIKFGNCLEITREAPKEKSANTAPTPAPSPSDSERIPEDLV